MSMRPLAADASRPRGEGSHPRFDDLPDGASWSHFGAGDQLGTINFLTPERVAAAAGLIRSGRRFGLDYAVDAFEPYPTGTRRSIEHHVFANNEFHRDDWVDSFYLQSSSQLDALRHIGQPGRGFYGGLAPADNVEGSTQLGVHAYAEAGIAGRGVLLDLPRYFEREGLEFDGAPYSTERTIPVDAAMLDRIAASQGVEFRGGELLLLRTAWAERYLAKSLPERAATPWRLSPGLAQKRDVLRWLWDHEIAVVAADNLAVEADPVLDSDFRSPDDVPPERGVDHAGMLHRPLIALLGMAVGELWRLDELGADCAADGVWEFFLTVKPLNLPGGVGSPPNALAIK